MSLNLAVIGCGIKACQYVDTWTLRDDVTLIAIADPNSHALDNAKAITHKNSGRTPCAYLDWLELLTAHNKELDAVYICTPHASHAEQALQALELNLDVLLEKPMVTSVTEANALISAQERSGKTLVVAYQGGLSPLVHQLKQDIVDNKYGELISINASIWEDWAEKYTGHWKQVPEISGGGFMFDTGAHMMNTMSMLCPSPLANISARMNNRGFPVDVVTTVLGELENGMPFTMQASGQNIGCASRIECFFTEYRVRICAWGRYIEIEDKEGNVERTEQEAANNLLNVFIQTKNGDIANPSDVHQGLKMAKLWDSIKLSASQNGASVNC